MTFIKTVFSIFSILVMPQYSIADDQAWAYLGVEGVGPIEGAPGVHSNLAKLGLELEAGGFLYQAEYGQSFGELFSDDSVQDYLQAEYIGNVTLGYILTLGGVLSFKARGGINYTQLEGDHCQNQLFEDLHCKVYDKHRLGLVASSGLSLQFHKYSIDLAFSRYWLAGEYDNESVSLNFKVLAGPND